MTWLDLKMIMEEEKNLMKERNYSKKIGENFIKFKKPIFGKDQFYKIGKSKVFIEVHKNFKKLLIKKNSTIFAILGGKIVDGKGRNIISYGDIIKTGTLKKLSQVFKIKDKLTVLRVSK